MWTWVCLICPEPDASLRPTCSLRRQETGLRPREPPRTGLLVALTPAPGTWVGSVWAGEGPEGQAAVGPTLAFPGFPA